MSLHEFLITFNTFYPFLFIFVSDLKDLAHFIFIDHYFSVEPMSTNIHFNTSLLVKDIQFLRHMRTCDGINQFRGCGQYKTK